MSNLYIEQQVQMPWFSQNNVPTSEFDMSYPIATHGCGICATCAALFKLFGNIIEPIHLRNMLQWRIENEGLAPFMAADGLLYKPFFDVLSKSFPVEVEQVTTTETAIKHLAEGHPLVSGNGGGVFKTGKSSGIVHPHVGHVICFYERAADYDNEYVLAMDSQICGGPRVRYSMDEFNAWVEATTKRSGGDQNSCYALKVRTCR